MRPIILDVAGYQLTTVEQEYLAHPLVAGVILFTRNFDNVVQLKELVQQIRLHAKQPILIGVDHEGGRVQRFRNGFTTLPACGDLLNKADSFEQTLSLAKASAFVMASELLSCDIDLSFAPVLDINGISDVIKERAFSSDKQQVTKIAIAYIEGMKQAGMASTGKHFPGHGSVKADSHIALPVDARPKEEIFKQDMLPFIELINANKLDAIMPSHVVYSDCDSLPCGFSDYWLQQILKSKLGFKGAIISDDISMHGASFVGNHLSRAEGALKAGCDFILACNDAPAAMTILDGLSAQAKNSVSLIKRLAADKGKLAQPLANNTLWQQSKHMIEQFNDTI
ncbi:beta-N-acetylhexosaminidase [Psychromonas sp. 14N.309.X.WAT.B.A12]|uniref:beta-N-acetylhexosaminidase n=1 Tax=unclassified Psychromonas TaxID=2614957 RepID=UPI0025B1521D|nr:beta-N-acetylhexosaminidase [Psychromonas sp. 14N.309.X.WAT.B.A12]MDN2662121.1 beta-N-acetylhexosaminidase [Psychromonas sp. 14N.309.X.WAT.B.A12]